MQNNMIETQDSNFGILYRKFIDRLETVLNDVEISDAENHNIGIDHAMELWHDVGKRIREKHQDLYMIGNGASASMCSHYAVDLSKNAGLRARTFNDSVLLTAMGNDICFEKAFSEALKLTGRPGDVLVAISSSGNSPNIVSGVEQAKAMNMYVITLTGMSPTNTLRGGGVT